MISRLFARKARTRRPPVPRLRLDRLEDRDVPATWHPVGSSTDATDMANWEFGAYESTLDNITFDSAYDGDCIGLEGDFDSISVNPGYTGTIELSGDVTVVMFYQGDGTIDQPLGEDSEITITQWWLWEGGTLNSTSTASTVTFDGSLYPGMASATIAPASGGAVSTGSTLNFVSASISIEPGTVTFTNSTATFIMDLASNATFNTALAAITFVQDNSTPVNWNVISNATYAGGAGLTTFGNPIRVTGRVSLMNNATVECNGGAANGAASVVTALQGAEGRGIYIEAGSTLRVAHKAVIEVGGTISVFKNPTIAANPNNGANPNLQKGTVDGTLAVVGGGFSSATRRLTRTPGLYSG